MLTTGTVLRNRYRILKVLGSGGFGVTYLAEDSDLPGQPRCVVKQLHPRDNNPETFRIAKSLFEREAEYLYRIGSSHPQIPNLFAHFTEDGEFYLVQEFIDGHNLAQEFPEGKKLSETETIRLLLDIFEVLAHVHQQNVIHRDIKLHNLMRRKADSKVVLIDFGAVKDVSVLQTNPQGGTNMTVSIGSPGYMPSEQAQGKPKLSSDVYAVGMIGIQVLTGIYPANLPEDVNTGEILWRDLVRISPHFAQVLDKMTHYHFGQRYRSAIEALEALRAVANLSSSLPTHVTAPPTALTPQTTPQHNQPTTPQTSDSSAKNKPKFLVAIIAGIAVVSASGIFLALWINARSSSPTVVNQEEQPLATNAPEALKPTPTPDPIEVTPTPSPESAFKKVEIKGLQSYKHPSGVYSMDVPQGWKLTDSSQTNIINQLWLDSSENAMIGVQVFEDTGAEARDVLTTFVQNTFGNFPGFTISPPVYEADSSIRVTWHYTTTINGISGKVRGNTYISKYPNRMVLHTVVVMADQFTRLEPIFDQILESFDINASAALP